MLAGRMLMSGGAKNRVVFLTTTFPWAPPAGVTTVYVTAVGPGGDGGAGAGAAGGGGGGAGGAVYASRAVSGSTFSINITNIYCTVFHDSSGDSVSVSGGTPGSGAAFTTPGAGGAGGGDTSGGLWSVLLSVAGSAGSSGTVSAGGNGANRTVLRGVSGTGGAGGVGAVDGGPGGLYGAGGGGGGPKASLPFTTGGVRGAGIVIIEW
jgi:hypothetical protein